MPWNETTRKQHTRNSARYNSDLADAEWALVEPLLPPSHRLGRPRRVDQREVLNAIQYMLWTGCAWRAIPKDFPPFATVQYHFYKWSRSGTLSRMLSCLVEAERGAANRSAMPSAAIVDSQSVSTVEASARTCGYDAGKKVKGRKRHLAVDANGNPLVVQVHQAGIQDRDGAVPLLQALHARRESVRTVFVDGGYGGDKLLSALKEASCPIRIEVVKKPSNRKGFLVLPRRWVVERTFGWLRRCRRLSKDVERTIASSLAWLELALIRVLMRRLGRHCASETS